MRTTLTHDDFTTILFEMKKLSLFFPEPLTVELGDWKDTIGHGFGGIAESWTTRGGECWSACGNCCRRPKYTCLVWYPGETHPDGAMTVDVKVNGQNLPLTIWSYDQQPAPKCEFLDEESPEKFCMAHDIRATMCFMGPSAGVYLNHYDQRYYLSRRPIGRNWAWPQCPVPMTTIPFTSTVTYVENDHILSAFESAIAFVDPGAYLRVRDLRTLLSTEPYEHKGRILIGG